MHARSSRLVVAVLGVALAALLMSCSSAGDATQQPAASSSVSMTTTAGPTTTTAAPAANLVVRYASPQEQDAAFLALTGGLASWKGNYYSPLSGPLLKGFKTRLTGWGRAFCTTFDGTNIAFALPSGDSYFSLNANDTTAFVAAAVGVYCPEKLAKLSSNGGKFTLVDGVTTCPAATVISVELNAAGSQYRIANSSAYDALVLVEQNITGKPDGWQVGIDNPDFVSKVPAKSSVTQPNSLGLTSPSYRVSPEGFLPLGCQGRAPSAAPGGSAAPSSTAAITTTAFAEPSAGAIATYKAVMTQNGHPELGDTYPVGQETCFAFTHGTDIVPEKQNLTRTHGYTPAQADTVVAAAVAAFCTQFQGVG